jgi:hypothetical protein
VREKLVGTLYSRELLDKTLQALNEVRAAGQSTGK